MTKEKEKEVVLALRQYMNEHISRFTYLPDMNVEKRYKQKSYEEKSLAIINGDINTISDCYIIYAIAKLGCADIETIKNYLIYLKEKDRDLSIFEFTKDELKLRLNALKKYGFLFNILYVNPAVEATKSTEQNSSYISLYTAATDAVTIMNAKLRKQVKPNQFIEHKPADELIGMAASSSVFTNILQTDHIVRIETGLFKGRNSGLVWLDSEFISEVSNVRYYVGMMSIYLHRQPNFLTDADIINIKDQKLNTIRDYLMYRTKKGIAKMILVCESNDDMVRFAQAILKSGAFDEEMLSNIHFTAPCLYEGGFDTDITKKFLSLDSLDDLSFRISEPFL